MPNVGNKSSSDLPIISYSLLKNHGFSLTELLIVVAIMLVLVVTAVPLYNNLHVESQLDDVASGLVSALRGARINSVARVNNSTYGLYVDSSAVPQQFVVYEVSAGVTPVIFGNRIVPNDVPTTLPSSLSISTTIPGGDISFQKGTGQASDTGSPTITVMHASGEFREITINPIGASWIE
jgi:prepilin-type N-terminal cleavage/methylation domain-containing protein